MRVLIKNDKHPSRLIQYPFQLRKDLIVYFIIPIDTKEKEIKRLCGFIETLSLENICEDINSNLPEFPES